MDKSILADIANEIRDKGHYQGQREKSGAPWLGVCLASNATMLRANRSFDPVTSLLGFDDSMDAIHWNDNTPTPMVLAWLDARAV